MAVKGKTKAKATPRYCGSCGKEHQSGLPGTFIVPSLLDPTVYLCRRECYDAWCADHPLPKSITEPRRHVDDDEVSVPRDPGPPLFEV